MPISVGGSVALALSYAIVAFNIWFALQRTGCSALTYLKVTKLKWRPPNSFSSWSQVTCSRGRPMLSCQPKAKSRLAIMNTRPSSPKHRIYIIPSSISSRIKACERKRLICSDVQETGMPFNQCQWQCRLVDVLVIKKSLSNLIKIIY